MNKQLEKSIIQTLSYFDYFDHPLTAEELFHFLWCPPNIDYVSFLRELESLEQSNIEFSSGFYFLPNRSRLVDIRRLKTSDNDFKNSLAKKAVKKIRWVPFVRSVFLCNNTSFEMASPKSDIDVVIVIKEGRMWIGRLLVTIILSILRMRRTKKKTTNRICLSFYASGKSLDFSDLKITEIDVGLIFWIMQFVAIYDPHNTLKEIFDINSWIRKFLPNAFSVNQISERFLVTDSKISKKWKRFWEAVWGSAYGNLIENQARAIQKLKMKLNTGSVQNEPDTRVIINDDVLKFHEKDKRLVYKEHWDKKIAEYTI